MPRQSKTPSVRYENANTLLMFLGIILILTLAVGLGFTFYSAYFAQQRLMQRAQLASMFAARCLNLRDRAGQINNMVAASRQLVFDSREIYDHVTVHQSEVEPLAKKLLDESREGAKLVEAERGRIAELTVQDIRDLTKRLNESDGNQESFVLPWVHMGKVAIRDLKLGYVSDLESNVEAPTGDPDLTAMDQRQIDHASSLYKGNITLALPAPDSDLRFKLSSLPAPVKGSISPMRLADNASFKPTLPVLTAGAFDHGECDQIPSAVQLTVTASFESSMIANIEQSMTCTTTAATNGACPRP